MLSGYASESVSRRLFPRAQIVGFHEFEDAFMALLAGRIEGFVYNEHVLNVGARAYPNRLKVLDEPISRESAVVLVSPKRPDLLPKVNAFISRFRKSGVYDDMFLLVSGSYFDADMKVLVKGCDDTGMMLGSTRLGYSKKLIRDPRVRLFVIGFFTTLALTLLSALVGFALARALREVDVRLPGALQRALAFVLDVIRLLPPPVVILLVGSAILTSADGWWLAVGAFAFWFAAFVEPTAKAGPRAWLPVVKTKLIELMQWTSVVGSISVCDLTMAADIVCGRTIAAFGPLVSVAAAYCLMNWIVERVGEWLEKRFA